MAMGMPTHGDSPGELPEPWEEYVSNGRLLYFHPVLNLCTRYKPTRVFEPPWQPYEKDGEQYYYNIESSLKLQGSWEEHMTSEMAIFYWNPESFVSSYFKPIGDLAAPWQAFESDGQTFYYNSATRESSWNSPLQISPIDHSLKSRAPDVWSNGRRAVLVMFTNKELRRFLQERGISVIGCLERSELFKLAEAWVEAQPTPPDLEPFVATETASEDTVVGLFRLLGKAPIARVFWQFLPLRGRNVCRSRALHPLSLGSWEGSLLVNGSCRLLSESELAADVVNRWQAFDAKVAEASMQFRHAQALKREAACPPLCTIALPS
mmetsp:Transcript_46969/g.73347  ORF Transcript_46969/g.73347 Transcript_46969/m.73347 type:complete len:321 (+) Transcript_46969:22-984(+)